MQLEFMEYELCLILNWIPSCHIQYKTLYYQSRLEYHFQDQYPYSGQTDSQKIFHDLLQLYIPYITFSQLNNLYCDTTKKNQKLQIINQIRTICAPLLHLSNPYITGRALYKNLGKHSNFNFKMFKIFFTKNSFMAKKIIMFNSRQI